jgi:hypothetical protein
VLEPTFRAECPDQFVPGVFPAADVDYLNGEISGFLDLVAQKGKRLE